MLFIYGLSTISYWYRCSMFTMLLQNKLIYFTVGALVIVSQFTTAAAAAARIHNVANGVFSLSKDECGVPPIKPDIGSSAGNIVGGKEAIPHSWPWQVEMQLYGYFVCGGSILAKRWVVVAAHCFFIIDSENLRSDDLFIIVGQHNRNETEPMKITIRGIWAYVHPGYNQTTLENDIALIKLETEISFNEYIQPVCLPTTDFKEGTMCATTGWGLEQPQPPQPPMKQWVGHDFRRKNDDAPDKLQEVAIPIFSQSECVKDYSQPPFPAVRDNMICAGYAEGGKGPCNGDSGGPLVCHGADGVWQLVGVTSWSSGCAQPDSPTVFTRVHVFNQWMKSIMQPGNV